MINMPKKESEKIKKQDEEDKYGEGILSDTEIRERLGKDLIVHPLLDEESQIKGSKIDLRLDGIFYEILHRTVESYDPLNPPERDYREKIILPPGEKYILHPRRIVLAPTFENVSVPTNLLGILQGRSSLGRLGIIVHATAGFIDPGYSGSITLELSNLGDLPVHLYPLMRVASLAFAFIKGKVRYVYEAEVPTLLPHIPEKPKYASPTSDKSKLSKDWEIVILNELKKDHSKATESLG
jgi:dCTP deaminase